MARRPGRGVAALLISVVTVACSTGTASEGPTPTTPATTSTSSAPETTTTITPTTSSTSPTTTTSSDDTGTTPEIDAEVTIPEGTGPFPAVVLVHGGGWVTGNPSIMRPLARALNAAGYLTVNTAYTLSTMSSPGFPAAVDDVACAVRFAAAHPDSNGSVAVIGHSAGAHIGALVALTGDDYTDDCDVGGTGVPDRFVGLAGPYDVSRLGIAVSPFFGTSPQANPGLWAAGNPQLLTDENTSLDSLILYGDRDGLVGDGFAFDFYEALEASGSSTLLERVEGARHSQMHDPEVVGDLIVTWLER